MIEEQNTLRYLGLILLSLLLIIAEEPTSYKMFRKAKKLLLNYRKKGKN
ncbi:hypothetical protein [Enterococcus hirae]